MIESSTGGNDDQMSTRREIDGVDAAAEEAGGEPERVPTSAGEHAGDQRDRQARRGCPRSAATACRGRGCRCRARAPARRQPPSGRVLSCSREILVQRVVRREQRRDSAARQEPRRSSPPAAARRRRQHAAGWPRGRRGSAMTQPRVQRRVGQVEHQVDHDEQRGKGQTRPWISGRSRLITASIAMLPMPG